LLSLSTSGPSAVFIYHNEYGVTFHPKLYLFTNQAAGRLIVGSNNLTEAGLFTNTEAGLQIDAEITDPLIVEARTALASWRDPSEGLAQPLDTTFRNDLLTEGYVLPEAQLRQRRQQSAAASRAGRQQGTARRRLFRRKVVTAPPVPRPVSTGRPAGAAMAGGVLLMRVRRESETKRRTQVQFPIRLVRTQFFDRITGIRSAHDNRLHVLGPTYARGKMNTIRVEIPEIDPMDEPVLRLERTGTGIVYQAFDANSILGRPIMDALPRGLNQDPSSTVLTVPGNPTSSTWYRFV
jgi:hypothetical protein